MSAIDLVIADDHPIVLAGLDELFRLQPDFRVVARCTDGDATLEAVRHHRPSILVLDVRMPGQDGLAVLRRLREEALSTRVVLLTAALDEDEILEAIRLGVCGVVLKEMAPQMLVQCVREVHAGKQWLDSRSVVRALEKVVRRGELSTTLTPREVEITRMVAGGLRNKEIAARLGIVEGTVKLHLHNIYEKLGLDGRLELMVYVRDRGIP